jgi:predicted RNA-binding Zn ribbon-like protein
MSSHLVAGVPLPDAVSGHPALDFCNTRAGWGAPAPKEYLTSPRALVLWAADAGLTPPPGGETSDGETGDGAVALHRALRLREALYRCALGRGTDVDWQAVACEAVAARAASLLAPPAGATPGAARWVLDADGCDPARLALHAVAAAADDLLTSPPAGWVSACPGAGCGWLFADRRRRRRWCSMAVCGNRAKARRHAARQRPGPLVPGP